ncbi:MAG: zinc ribbon domain-containing protein [Deltaproteobacteria bacterium]|nr:zinc ribbon domain-containing protein [Deltaproteobacteria bacterium]
MSATLTCRECQAEMASTDRYCPSCGHDTELDGDLAALDLKVRQARGWILAVGIIYAVSAVLMLVIMGRDLPPDARNLLLVINLGLCVIHIGLWLWAKTQAFAAAVVAFVLFITVQAVDIASDPTALTRGIFIKVFFIIALVSAIRAGLEARALVRASRAAR